MDPALDQTQLQTQSHNGVPLDVTPDPLPPLPPPPPQFPAPTSPAATQGGPSAPPTVTMAPTSIPVKTKEGEPVVAKPDGDAYWESYAREIELEKEIAEMGGVEKVETGEVKLPQNLAKEMGIKPSVTADTPIAKVVPDFTIRGVTLTDDQLGNGLTKPMSSGFRWLVEWFIYQLLKAHFLVKKIKGKVARYSPPKNQPTTSTS